MDQPPRPPQERTHLRGARPAPHLSPQELREIRPGRPQEVGPQLERGASRSMRAPEKSRTSRPELRCEALYATGAPRQRGRDGAWLFGPAP